MKMILETLAPTRFLLARKILIGMWGLLKAFILNKIVSK